ncbi:hypothetical protein [Priestia taiwanensis]|uniref:Uncharacterized protein n=1 Tax=Priestia taiwanensis TaxID=1347902 RepID=A0A917AWD1_9BACI|nr:hypothetical protein [Priestia taiwanensis]MBM7364656.1 hypothetical protein [Priestia taiwanensis]GGE78566.1 hypothetical protein GCM10007140_30210 [Priestia taiwanensis]
METKRTEKLLEIDVSTLREYAEALEKQGYKFHKNERGHRGDFEKDIIAVTVH